MNKMLGTAIATLALAAMPLASTAFAAPPITKGLVSLSVQGVGTGSLATDVFELRRPYLRGDN